MRNTPNRNHTVSGVPIGRSLDETIGVPGHSAHRAAVLRLLLWITTAGSLLFTALNLAHHHWALAVIELGLAIYALILLKANRNRSDPGHYALAYVIPLSAVILYGYITVPLDDSIYVWMLVVPMVSYILLGQRQGFAVTLGFFTLAVVASLFKLEATAIDWDTAAINLVVCFVSVAGLAHVYEVVRSDAEERLRTSALRDSLTGVFNRTGVNMRFDHHTRTADGESAPLALILLDLDHFKRINDSHGHQAGDDVLRRVARCIDAQTEAQDTIGRLGGEEFVVLLPDRGLEQARDIAERIRCAIESSHGAFDMAPIEVTATLGVAARDRDESLDTLLERADARLYRGKLNNRNQVVATA
ncbi:GGDEF domain-containing protein [Salinisphaera sp. RV14]|uniref:GGDEF domain-containing protein n=1 Tax=unclassified Salinisphaera TaxID=2649847 RepID=UPI003F876D39